MSGCAYREVTAGRDGEVFVAGTTVVFERHSDAFKSTAITIEVMCGADVKRYTIAGTSCEERCILRSNICNVELLRGEVAKVDIGKFGVGVGYWFQSCEFSNDIQTYSEGPGAIPHSSHFR
ncbi:MAG: hypothetical protein KBG15_05315 [Kofleriaceae bacterium]|nr:hypothetical protein [Kofleriaceae bacterium]